jgi:AcrR family transcriptional regulator
VNLYEVMGLREKQKGQRRDQILEAARRLIRATGGTDFPMRTLADEAQVSLVTPYNLFGSKTSVLYALLNESLETLDRAVETRPSTSPVNALLAVSSVGANTYVSDAAFYRPLVRAVFGVRDREHRPRALERSLRLWSRPVETAVRGGLLARSVDTALLARQLMVTFIGVLELWIHEDLDDQGFLAQSMYGSALLVLAHASPAGRPRLAERVRAIERRLPRRLGVTKKKRARAA